ncbi:1,5-anhydro-D-fructose reductase (1,5-anhydro-D-mannitol-forming) [Rhodoferax sp. OV413]|uniref:Gfo/Idh/MocA family protein n=1 Tax=Rhodoferax sp. OV413 TaxID=1855285 RepID=UPI00088E2AE6|nr:Gfo/Idh/MocA family oxidoreductase [Rhodoferax sp. OV413]SDO93292.1 1,5-anhydro-D-fructose reductase (1,5-anhydro-D-mannitol-forming) [Rhodoferax sp. OV413]
MRWAFIGASTIAGEWMVAAVRSAGDEVVVVVSGDLARARAFANSHGIAHATDDEAAIAGLGVDAVYISSTNEKHEASVLHAARLGLHVLCEKPLATSLVAAQRMVQACAQAGVVMGTNHHLRHNSAHRQMRDKIQQGGLGRLVSARVNHSVYLPAHLQGWRLKDKGAGGGVVLDIAVHNADSLAFLLGEYPTEVVAMTSNSGMAEGMEDNAMSVWRFPSGLTAFTHQGFNTPYAEVGLEVHGTQGSLQGVGILHQGPDGRLNFKDGQGTHELPLDQVDLYSRGVQNFHLAIQGQPHDMADGQAGLRSLAVALAVLESAQTGRSVTVPYPGAAA